MPNLYVTEQNAVLRKRGDRIVVEKERKVLLDVPCLHLDQVLVFGNVQFTTQALVEMLDHGIEMAIFTLSGRLRGQLTPPKAKNVELRMAQYDRVRDEGFLLAFGQAVVRGKVLNAVAHLRRFRANHPEAVDAATLEALEASARRVDSAASLDALRGIEGAAARRTFAALPKLLPAEITFPGRRRRPPRDPVNALLSFGYVLVGNELQALLDGIGFDPYLGFFHQLDYGRPSLALDLLEEFRPALVDRFTIGLFNRGVVRPADFVAQPGGGVALGAEGRQRYFAAFERELNTPRKVEDGEASFRDLFRRQAHRLAATLQRGEPYLPFRLPC